MWVSSRAARLSRDRRSLAPTLLERFGLPLLGNGEDVRFRLADFRPREIRSGAEAQFPTEPMGRNDARQFQRVTPQMPQLAEFLGAAIEVVFDQIVDHSVSTLL